MYEAVQQVETPSREDPKPDGFEPQGISSPGKLQPQTVIKEITLKGSEDEQQQFIESARKEARLQSLLKDAPQVWGQMVSAD